MQSEICGFVIADCGCVIADDGFATADGGLVIDESGPAIADGGLAIANGGPAITDHGLATSYMPAVWWHNPKLLIMPSS